MVILVFCVTFCNYKTCTVISNSEKLTHPTVQYLYSAHCTPCTQTSHNHSISQYCRQELWCRFYYNIRLSLLMMTVRYLLFYNDTYSLAFTFDFLFYKKLLFIFLFFYRIPTTAAMGD